MINIRAIEMDHLRLLRENQDSAISALERKDWAAYRALAKEEAQLMDVLHVIWNDRRDLTNASA